jgi:hypothetical protein
VNDRPVGPEGRRTRVVGAAKRLALREYLPLGGWVLSWFMIGLAVGHADAVRLLAANAFVQAIRHLCTVEAMQAFGLRSRSQAGNFKQARRAALLFELGGLAGCAVATVIIVMILGYRGMHEAAGMVAIVAAAIPARTPGALLVAHRKRLPRWRIASAITFVVGSAVVFLLGLNWVAAAIVLALREWGGLVGTLIFAPKRSLDERTINEPLTFAEAARRTEAGARQKLSYRLISSVSSLVLGPFGNLAARTGRELGKVDSRLARLVPRSKTGFILFTIGTAAVAAFFLIVSREPSTLLAAAAFTRLSASGASVLLWWRYAGQAPEDEELDED